MKITEIHRSLIATAFVAGHNGGKRVSLCCASDGLEACAAIVGKSKAEALQAFCYESLGCGYYHAGREQDYLDKISTLEVL